MDSIHREVLGDEPPQDWEIDKCIENFNELSLFLPNEYSLKIVYNNVDNCTEMFVVHPSFTDIMLASLGGHFFVPAFRLSEVELLISVAEPLWKKGFDEFYLYPLLHAFVSILDSDDTSKYEEKLLESMKRIIDISSEKIEKLVKSLLSKVSYFKWWQDKDLGWINVCEYSYRNPLLHKEDLWGKEKELNFGRIKTFLKAMADH